MVPKRFFLLDILRGFASLAVVVWHYQHFFYTEPGGLPNDFDRESQPFYIFLSLFYEHGDVAVELFFVLSGFIFFWLYLEKIQNKSVSAKEFFILRFSRLYPLHFVTLIFVAVSQSAYHYLNGKYIVYPSNDAKHFLLNLFFASHWGIQGGWSFNAPVWSVSVEVLLYSIFFVFAWLRRNSFWSMGFLMGAGLVIARFTGNDGLGWGVFCFFAGGGVYFFYDKIRSHPLFSANRVKLTLTSFLITTFLAFGVKAVPAPISTVLNFGGLFPWGVLSLALLQEVSHNCGRRWRLVGDITYSTYLLHFPLQLSIIGVATYLNATIDYRASYFFLCFFFALIVVSVVVYKYFELPAQFYLRRKLLVGHKANFQ